MGSDTSLLRGNMTTQGKNNLEIVQEGAHVHSWTYKPSWNVDP